MVAILDSFPRAKFGDIEFPYEDRTVEGAIREFEHKYPHAPGAALETLGRELYAVRFKCSFQNTFAGYPDLYPSSLARLRRMFETETRDDLVVPGLGTIKAVCITWSQRLAGKESRSGEKVDLLFREDIEDAFLVNNLIGVSNQSLNAANQQWAVDVDAIRKEQSKHPDLKLFDAIHASVNSVLAIVDQGEVYGNVLEAKVLGAASLIYQADRRARLLNDPIHATGLHSFLQLWDALLTLFKDLQKTGGNVQTFIVQKVMSVIEISKALYHGDGTRAVEVMQMNALQDVFAVAPGTAIRYYPKKN